MRPSLRFVLPAVFVAGVAGICVLAAVQGSVRPAADAGLAQAEARPSPIPPSPFDCVPSGIRDLVAQQPTLALRIAKAFEIDPSGWSSDGYIVHWRGGLSIWVGNGAEALGSFPDQHGTPDWPIGDARFDADRDVVWAAYQHWRQDRAVVRNAALFATLGPAPDGRLTLFSASGPSGDEQSETAMAQDLRCAIRSETLCLTSVGQRWERTR